MWCCKLWPSSGITYDQDEIIPKIFPDFSVQIYLIMEWRDPLVAKPWGIPSYWQQSFVQNEIWFIAISCISNCSSLNFDQSTMIQSARKNQKGIITANEKIEQLFAFATSSIYVFGNNKCKTRSQSLEGMLSSPSLWEKMMNNLLSLTVLCFSCRKTPSTPLHNTFHLYFEYYDRVILGKRNITMSAL